MPSLTFFGAAGTVTGSKHLLDLGTHRVLVDCGLFQGLKELRVRNWAALPVDPRRIDAVVLTHAHLDHCGYLPRLVGAGLPRPRLLHARHQELCSLVLPDSAHIQEEDARHANRRGYSKHQPALPLYTELDAARALTQLQPVGYDRPVPIVPGLEVEFINAGHLLGSAYARITGGRARRSSSAAISAATVVRCSPIRRRSPKPTCCSSSPPTAIACTSRTTTGSRLAAIVNETAQRGGKLIIPSFAIGRVEEVLYWLKRLEDEQRIPVLPVFVDSPMAAGALQFYSQHLNELDADVRTEARRVSTFSTERLTVVASPQESADLVASPQAVDCDCRQRHGDRRPRAAPPRRVPAGSEAHGAVRRLSGGRHSRPAAGRRRQADQDARAVVPVLARVTKIDSMSAHADAGEIMRWLGRLHAAARDDLSRARRADRAGRRSSGRSSTTLGWRMHIAGYLERVELP